MSSRNSRSIVKTVLLLRDLTAGRSGNRIRRSGHMSRIIKVDRKSIVVSAIESNDEIRRFILTLSGATSSKGRIRLSIRPIKMV